MDKLTFISSVITALAWPATVLISVYILRTHLIGLLSKIHKLTLPGGIEAEFNETLEEVEKVLDKIPSPPESTTPNPPSPEPDLKALQFHPTGVVMETWKELEVAARQLLERAVDIRSLAFPVQQQMSTNPIRFLMESKAITPEEWESAEELRRLRNRAAHEAGASITSSDAKRFMEIAKKLASIWRRRTTLPPSPE